MYLITGSAGHLGEALVRTLRGAGQPCRGIDRLPSPYTDIVGSLVDREHVELAMRGIDVVLHTATLHKPHVATHSRQAFVDTNITGTLNLLEAAVRARVRAFVFTSTTSTFGDALVPPPDAPAAWIDERVVPVPKNIYGVTKVAAEDLCQLAHRNDGLACLILRTSRFFPEQDDDPRARAAFGDANLKVNELLYRRVDLEDVVDAHLRAAERAPALGFGRFIISAPTLFRPEDMSALRRDAPGVLRMRMPAYAAAYDALGWRMASTLDRVYDSTHARTVLSWSPRHDFASVLARVRETGDPRSELARRVGSKGYHR